MITESNDNFHLGNVFETGEHIFHMPGDLRYNFFFFLLDSI